MLVGFSSGICLKLYGSIVILLMIIFNVLKRMKENEEKISEK